MIVNIPHLGKDIPFEQASDEWYQNTEYKLAISPDMSVCHTHPWYSDHICDAPEHKFTVVN